MKGVEKLVPELRFPEYENEWESKKLKFVLRNSRIKGGDASLTIFSVTQGHGLVPRESLDRKMADCANVSDNLQIQPKDLVYNMMRMWQGAIGLSYWTGMVSPAYIVLRPIKDVCSEFIINFFNRSRSLYLFWAYSYGVTNDRLRLYYKDFASISLAIPTLPEQKKIASFFSAVDKKIEKLTRKKELLLKYKKGVMQKIFSREIRFKDENGNDYPDWSKKTFGALVKRSRSKYNPEKDCKNYPCIELENIAKDQGVLISSLKSKEQKSVKNKFSQGDVLFGKLRPNLKKYLLAPFEGVCSSEIWVFRGITILNDFLFFLIQTNKFYKVSNVTFGSKMPRSDWEYISSIPFLIPEILEQQKIANFLSFIDKKIKTIQTQLTQTQEFKKGLLQKMFV